MNETAGITLRHGKSLAGLLALAGLYFLVASGFTLVFGLLPNINLAHGSLYLLGAYIGYSTANATGFWLLGIAAGMLSMAVAGVLLQVLVFRRLEGDDLRPTLVTIGISIVAADVIGVALWLVLNRTRIGMMIRAGADDRAMLLASGVNVQRVFAVVFAIGAGLAGFAAVVGGSVLSVARGKDVRYLLASLVVVIVGGMSSVTGAAVGALLVGLAEQIGLVYVPTYGVVLTFVIMVIVLAIRPQDLMGAPRRA